MISRDTSETRLLKESRGTFQLLNFDTSQKSLIENTAVYRCHGRFRCLMVRCIVKVLRKSSLLIKIMTSLLASRLGRGYWSHCDQLYLIIISLVAAIKKKVFVVWTAFSRLTGSLFKCCRAVQVLRQRHRHLHGAHVRRHDCFAQPKTTPLGTSPNGPLLKRCLHKQSFRLIDSVAPLNPLFIVDNKC